METNRQIGLLVWHNLIG